MYAFSKSLGDAAKAARSSLKYTQAQVADLIDAEVRTVMHIENYKANPQMDADKIIRPGVVCNL